MDLLEWVRRKRSERKKKVGGNWKRYVNAQLFEVWLDGEQIVLESGLNLLWFDIRVVLLYLLRT